MITKMIICIKNKFMKNILQLIITFFVFNVYAQKEAAPEYLLNQKFPDSVTKFEINNRKGEKVTFKEVLEKHKGKKVVLDFWASWCKQCRKGMPSLQALQKETEGKPIDYVFISLDKKIDRWEAAIEKENLKGDHYIMIEGGWKNKNILTKYINLDWIPRYMILDEEGKVVFSKTLTASDEKFKEVLFK